MLTLTAAATPGLAGGHPAGGQPSGGTGRPSPSAPPAAQAGHSAPAGGPALGRRGVIVHYPARGRRHLPRVPASAYVIADAGTGQVLAAKDPHGRYRPASTLKVLTAITLMPRLDRNQRVRATRRAAGMEPSKVGLLAGRRYRAEDLFRALLLISANDAAVSLAQATGSYAKGVAMMNAEARHLRAGDTVARTPNGLDARGQRVSAYDEALFARRALAIPQFMRIEKMRRAWFPRRRHHSVALWNQNTMLQTFRGDLGGKIGWTTPAKATFIGWAKRGHRALVVTLLHDTPGTELNSAARLLRWGFAMDGKVQPVGTLVRPLPEVTTRRAGHPRRAAAARPGGSLGGPVAIGAGTLAAAGVLGGGITLAVRRRRAGSQPAP